MAQNGSNGSDFTGVGGAGGGADIPGVKSGGAGGAFSSDGLGGSGAGGGFGGGGGGGADGGNGGGSAGNGGFGGGGGGSTVESGSGGFGGRGGSLGYFVYLFNSASGGWVDSGTIDEGIDPYTQGGPAGAGGFGAGRGGQAGGGGGLGAGGAVFVMQGATLNITGGTLANGTVAGGAGKGLSADGIGPGSPGQAYGAGIFIQGNQSITFGTGQAAGQTTTIDGDVADQTGSGGGGGAGEVIVEGNGTVVLGGNNTYTGGTDIRSGRLTLANSNAGGTGPIKFSADTTLQIDGTTTPSNIFDGFTPGDIIDLASVGYAVGALVRMDNATNVLRVTEGSKTYELHFNPKENFTGDSFKLQPVGGSGNGTEIIVTGPTPSATSQMAQAMATFTSSSSASTAGTISDASTDSSQHIAPPHH
jgi:hypothetical protein